MQQESPASRKVKIGVIFGGSGLIGGTVVNFFKLRRPGIVEMLAPSSKKVSLRDCQDIRNYLMSVRPDFVINAAITKIDASPQLSFEVNYIGPVNIARAVAALKIPYIHISSAASLPLGKKLREEDRLPLSAGLNNYAKSKIMAETSLEYMAEHQGIDHSCIRLGIAYGNHDHKTKGFHRLLFSIANGSMPFLFTRKGVKHSYSNSRKLPYLIHHMLENRHEFKGKTYHFVDPKPVELDSLILAIRSHLKRRSPRKIYIPYSIAKAFTNSTGIMLRLITRIGAQASLPPELIFLKSFYRTQTLSCDRLAASSFNDPFPDETVYTRLPEMITYYMTRWRQQNMLTRSKADKNFDDIIRKDFEENPQALVDTIHRDATSPFS